jgi:hypothetical protein
LPPHTADNPNAFARFQHEAQAVAALSYPNILAVHDCGRTETASYVVFELLEGATVRDRLAGGPLPVRKAVEYGRQVADGLAAAHARQITYRDIKPDHLFVTERIILLPPTPGWSCRSDRIELPFPHGRHEGHHHKAARYDTESTPAGGPSIRTECRDAGARGNRSPSRT